MDVLRRHEIYEIETLEKLKNAGFLGPLVFGGGTMLRLCYNIPRYSADLDFWFVREVDKDAYFARFRQYLEREYELTDSEIKLYTLLFEIRSEGYPKRLKIEIRKRKKDCDFQDTIAFSEFSTKQIILRTHTLEQSMTNKIEAALERKDIRDCFDIEFLLRRGIPLSAPREKLCGLRDVVRSFSKNDYKVTLGSVLDAETRDYYVNNGFTLLLDRIDQLSEKQFDGRKDPG